ncbi:S8 family peptidase [Alkaliphilus transvaalensis]|uniref:S8 family peptidase n=1 Tax=Alkaliphilus transvaalensis TaxID=114628 RepID=UPI00047D05D8|nr:S8 family peptidase [Alkaliphilus transvaalensis]
MFGYRGVIEDILIEKLMVSEDEHIPVIITGKDCQCDDLEAFVHSLGGKVKHKLNIINAVAVYLPTVGVRNVAREKVIEKIFFDDMAFKLMDVASVTVGSDYANELRLTGKGVGVAVIDTGVHPHSDLVTPNNRIIAFKDFVNNKNQPYDDDGHGTHVAGCIAGNGFASRGKYMGVAPDANIIGIKVLNQDGGGSISDVIAGIQWAVDNRRRYNIKVLTLSLGTAAKKNYQQDPLCQAVDAATAAGITVVVAAGNNGPKESTINSPAISPNVIAVGACDDRKSKAPKDVTIADFSSRGPTIDGLSKPDILAPGVNINSLSNEGNNYRSLSGTSMATPIVAGCAALLWEKNPETTPLQVKNQITSHALPLGFNPDSQGAGLLDIKKIVNGMSPKPSPNNPPNSPHTKKPQGLIGNRGSWFWVLILVIILIIL